jgi:hypothetical protein
VYALGEESAEKAEEISRLMDAQRKKHSLVENRSAAVTKLNNTLQKANMDLCSKYILKEWAQDKMRTLKHKSADDFRPAMVPGRKKVARIRFGKDKPRGKQSRVKPANLRGGPNGVMKALGRKWDRMARNQDQCMALAAEHTLRGV